MADFAIHDKVRLLQLTDDFFIGIETSDAKRLKELIGREWIVSGKSEHGHIEIEFAHSAESPTPLEWVCVPPDWIERVS